MSEVNHPHDHFFRLVFAQPEHAADFLQNYLPRDVAALLDFATLEPLKDSFVDEALRETFADLLFLVRGHAGGDAYVYVLIEHKSQPERDTVFQLLRYMVRIWERQRASEPDAPLRPIIPHVVYHGTARWSAPTTFGTLFSGPEALRPYWPEFSIILQDVARMSDEEIVGLAMIQAVMQVLKHARSNDLDAYLPRIVSLLVKVMEQHDGRWNVYAVLLYLSQVARRMSVEELRSLVKDQLGSQGDAMMDTLAEQWIEEGKQEKAINFVVDLLQHRFGPLPEMLIVRLNTLSSAQLDQLFSFSLDAGSLGEVTAFVNTLPRRA